MRRAPTASASSPPTTTTTAASISSWPTTRTRTSSTATAPPGSAPRFESVGLIAGVAVNGEARAQAGMGADAGDYDGDGRIDLVLTAFAHDRNTLYRNVDGGSFEDASGAAGLAARTFARMGWGDGVPRRRPRRPARSLRRQRPHLRGRRSLPRARRDLRAEEPAPAQPGRHVPRRVGPRRRAACRCRGSAAASPSAISTTTAIPTSS